ARPTNATDADPVATGFLAEIDALVCEQARPTEMKALTASGNTVGAHVCGCDCDVPSPLISECAVDVGSKGVAWPAASATAVNADVTLPTDVANVSCWPNTVTASALPVALPENASGLSPAAGLII